ncbi:hypothetical protein XF24_00043 [candidate division SR1 bacterium Aalborg_AAW-1]|nr:hypothetical protein XF24_00043 [candidate division SR1 bacterium Aalborg_AAW-1]
MQSYSINSTTIRHIFYRKKKQRLIIEFMSGGVYEYKKVPKYIVQGFVQAHSVGIFFKDNIRNNYFYRKTKDYSSEMLNIKKDKKRKHPSEALTRQ